jgi:hypothetical protein
MKCRVPIRRLLSFVGLGALCAIFAVQLEGCTAIGFVVGGMADAGNATGGPRKLVEVGTGQHVILDLWDGSRVEGRFLGWQRDSAATPAPGEVVSPQGARVRVRTDGGEVVVPVERVAQVTVPRNTGRVVGTFAGLAVDVIVICALQDPVKTSGSGCEGSKDVQFLGVAAPVAAGHGAG